MTADEPGEDKGNGQFRNKRLWVFYTPFVVAYTVLSVLGAIFINVVPSAPTSSQLKELTAVAGYTASVGSKLSEAEESLARAVEVCMILAGPSPTPTSSPARAPAARPTPCVTVNAAPAGSTFSASQLKTIKALEAEISHETAEQTSDAAQLHSLQRQVGSGDRSGWVTAIGTAVLAAVALVGMTTLFQRRRGRHAKAEPPS